MHFSSEKTCSNRLLSDHCHCHIDNYVNCRYVNRGCKLCSFTRLPKSSIDEAPHNVLTRNCYIYASSATSTDTSQATNNLASSDQDKAAQRAREQVTKARKQKHGRMAAVSCPPESATQWLERVAEAPPWPKRRPSRRDQTSPRTS